MSKQPILLDTNAGIPPYPEILEEYTTLSRLTNNSYGFTEVQLTITQKLREYHDFLASKFNADRVLFTSGSTEIIKQLFCTFGSQLYVYPGQHPLVDKLAQNNNTANNLVCLINLVDSTTGEYHIDQLKEAREKFKYIVVDCTQAVGKKSIDSNIKVDCLFFSGHKFGATYGTGFLMCSDEFYKNFWQQNSAASQQNTDNTIADDDNVTEDLAYNGTINYPGYITTVSALRRIENYDIAAYQKIWQKLYTGLSKLDDEIENIQPQPRTPQTYNTLLFEFKEKNREILCPRSFQHILAENGYQIGFKTACSANSTGQLRISFLLSQLPTNFDVDAFIKTFYDTIQQVRSALAEQKKTSISSGGFKLHMPSNPDFVGGKLAEQLLHGDNNNIDEIVGGDINGGDRDATTTEFFNEVNKKNNFYLNSHWVPSHDQPPQINVKYAKMFQKELFTLPYEISLSIPPHNEIHRKEIDVQKAKYSDQLYDINDDKIYIQQRRLARTLWLNKPDAEITLSLENFETFEQDLYFSPILFNYISNNKLITNKRKPETHFTKQNTDPDPELLHYTITVRNYPETLLQDIVLADKPARQAEIEKLTKIYQKENSDIADDVEKQDFINFQISVANIKFLNKLAPCALSDTILYNLRPRPTKLRTYPKNYNPHQKIVIDENFYDAYTLDGNWLTAINTQYSYIKLNKTIEQPKIINTNNPDNNKIAPNIKFYYCNIQTEPPRTFKNFIEENRRNTARLYTIYTTEDNITEDYGDYNWLLQNGFTYEIKPFTYYDVWDQRFYDDITMVCFSRYTDKQQRAVME